MLPRGLFREGRRNIARDLLSWGRVMLAQQRYKSDLLRCSGGDCQSAKQIHKHFAVLRGGQDRVDRLVCVMYARKISLLKLLL